MSVMLTQGLARSDEGQSQASEQVASQRGFYVMNDTHAVISKETLILSQAFVMSKHLEVKSVNITSETDFDICFTEIRGGVISWCGSSKAFQQTKLSI